ncbi:cytochrome b/b6 domain-containing protein [Planktothrix sp. FACHB-1365]|uniref:cytochrome b/b6 domain-containing protein n=1 Tax=Planktothrix sp. FACHB-1365 TaxID=2692855 RepID=UPI0016870205|nr:cytochrome b/b6 domain-containing protein [Planktothrix sp. FACHB-1365]MBD2480733.1 cytochrome b/b6 domain-containing protein [Planktothrix sp. FACHB-1365]
MAQSQPYQPLFLRLSHALNAFLVLGALVTGFLVYDSYDRRFGGLGLTQENRNLIDIHGTFGFFLLFVYIIFAVYSLIAERKRLIQGNTLQTLTQINKPVWWYTLLRLSNTLALIAAAFSVISGKFQQENWLPNGEFNHLWYFVHLIAWVIILFSILLHVLMVVKVGGFPLIVSMFKTNYKPQDHPKLWLNNIQNWCQRFFNK